MKDMTLGDVDKRLKLNGQRMAVSFSGGQYHAYVFRGESLEHYDRADDLAPAVQRAIQGRGSKP